MTKFNEQVKAVGGFITGVIGVIVTRVATGESVLPAVEPVDVAGWGSLFAVATLVYLGVYIPPNALNAKQVAKGMTRLPADDQIDAACEAKLTPEARDALLDR